MSGTNRKLVDTARAAERLNIRARTLDHWRWRGIGPKYHKVGRLVRYDESDIDAWLDSQKYQHTSQHSAAHLLTVASTK
jgi:predicted DNA-binding transcriptional regulator AlpA